MTTTSKTSMPSITATAVTSATSTTSSWTTPTITPPSTEGNPYIWRSTAPTGTVFIAVAAVAGFLLVCLLMFLLVRSILARRAAKRSLSLTDSSSSSFHQGGAQEKNMMMSSTYSSTTNLRKSVSQGKIPLLYETKMDNSLADVSDAFMKSNEALFSTLDPQDNKRRSMFISPTAEVMNLNKSHKRVLSSSVGQIGSTTDVSSVAQQRQNYHERDGSYDNYPDVSLQSPDRGATRAYKARSRAVPSQYLESMFEDA